MKTKKTTPTAYDCPRAVQKRSTAPAKSKKPKVGIYGITGCMGCQLNILYQPDILPLLELIDLRSFPVGKEKNKETDPFDIIFLEGVIVNEKDLSEVKRLRSMTKLLIAIGACATDGCVPAIRNFMPTCATESLPLLTSLAQRDEEPSKNSESLPSHSIPYSLLPTPCSLPPSPIDAHVSVDGYIRGCPMDKQEFLLFMKRTLLGETFKIAEKPICYECNLRERGCLLEEGRECLGPITTGNCSVMCPLQNYGCIGCRGPYREANLPAYFKLLQSKGIPVETIKSHISRFAGVKFAKRMEEVK